MSKYSNIIIGSITNVINNIIRYLYWYKYHIKQLLGTLIKK